MSNVISTDVEKKAGTALIVAGYVFAVLGGLIGVAIGANLRNSKVAVGDGRKMPKYDASSRKHGLIISVIALSMIVVGVGLNIAMQ